MGGLVRIREWAALFVARNVRGYDGLLRMVG